MKQIPPDHEHKRKPLLCGWDWLALFLLLGGVVLHFWALGAKSFWYDEVSGAKWAGKTSLWEILTHLDADSHPPLTALFTHLFLNFGRSGAGAWIGSVTGIDPATLKEFWIRFYPALCASLVPGVAYLIARNMANRLSGIFAMLFLLLSPMNIFYSQDARPYAPLMLYTALSMWFLYLALHSNQRKHWIWYGVFTLASLYTHFFAIFSFLAQGLFVLISVIFTKRSENQGWHPPRKILLPFVITAGLTTLFFVPMLLQGLRSNSRFVPPDPPYVLVVETYYDLLSSLGIGYLHVLLFTIALVVIAVWRLMCNKNSRSALLTFLLFLIPFVLVPITIALTTKFWNTRFAFAAQFPWLLLAGMGAGLGVEWAVKDAPGIWRRVYTIGLTVVLVAITAWFTILPIRAYFANEKTSMRQAVQLAFANYHKGDAVINVPPQITWVMDYYWRGGDPLKETYNNNEAVDWAVHAPRAFIFTTRPEIAQELRNQGMACISLEMTRVWLIVVDREYAGKTTGEILTSIKALDERTRVFTQTNEKMQTEMPDVALLIIKDWCMKHPDDIYAWVKYAMCDAAIGNNLKAIEHIEQVIIREPGGAWPWVMRADFQHTLGKNADALFSLRNALLLAPGSKNLEAMLVEWSRK